MEVHFRPDSEAPLNAQMHKIPFRLYLGLIYLAIGFFLFLYN